ncbi:hypothetical protein JCM6882_000051 [Rhodosporidiobolus microsporus]
MEGQADETVHDSAALDSTSVNPVPPTSAEADAFGQDLAPELFPQGVPGTVESGVGLNAVPGQDEAEHVMQAEDELPVPPPLRGDGAELQEQVAGEGEGEAKMDADEDDEDAGDDLFGDGGDDDDDDVAMQDQEPAAAASPEQAQGVDDDGLTAAEKAARRRLEYEEDSDAGGEDLFGEGAAAAQHETRDVVQAQVPMANFSVPPGGKVWHARLPGFLQIAPNPYDENTWQPDDSEDVKPLEDEASQEDVKPKGARAGRIPDENVVRWRWTKNELQQVIQQTNARVVKWSDGTLSLQLGSELFDLTLALDHSAVLTGVSSALPVPPTLNPTSTLTPTTFDASRAHGLSYLTARHSYNGQMSEAQASIYGTIGMRPAALTSRTHKKLAGAIASRNALNKGKSTQRIIVDKDPELARAEREKKEAERAKKAQREARKAAGGGRRGGGRKGGKKATTIEGLSDEEDEDAGDSDDEAGGYGERRSQSRRGRGGPFGRDYSDDDDGFVAKSDDDMALSDDGPEELEEADDAIERDEARRRKDRTKKRDVSSSPEPEKEESAAPRRRLVVESDEDE